MTYNLGGYRTCLLVSVCSSYRIMAPKNRHKFRSCKANYLGRIDPPRPNYEGLYRFFNNSPFAEEHTIILELPASGRDDCNLQLYTCGIAARAGTT